MPTEGQCVTTILTPSKNSVSQPIDVCCLVERVKYLILFLYIRASQVKMPYLYTLTNGASTTWSIKDHSLLITFKTQLY